MSRQKLFLAAFATAFLWWLAMQKFGAFALGWIAFAPLLLAAGEITSRRTRFFYGWCAGILCFALHNWWLLPTITKASVMIGVPPAGGALLGILSVALIALGHGLGVAALVLLWNPRAAVFRRAPFFLPIAAALLWLGFEWLRGSGELAHSWGAPAFSQWRDTALLQVAPLLGPHGLSALCIWFGASLALWLKPEYSARVPNLWRVPVVVFALLHLWGAWRIWDYDRAPHRMLPVLLVQTNVSSLLKNVGRGESHFDQAERLTREWFQHDAAAAGRMRSDGDTLIVWPETTATLFKSTPQDYALSQTPQSKDVRRIIDNVLSYAPILVGSQIFYGEGGLAGENKKISNQAVLFFADGRGQMFEDSSPKTRVVPFGERAPFPELLPFLAPLAPYPPVVAGQKVKPLDLGRNGTKIGTLICFESCFSRPAKNLVEQGAQVLFVLTNDEWFAGTTAPWEHAAMSVVRAAESGVPVAQCANGGYSFAVDARGRFLAEPESGRARAFEVEIPLAAGR